MPDRRLLMLLVLALAACGSGPGGAEEPPTPGPSGEQIGPLTLGDWANYPAPEASEWPVEPLDDARWALATAELACIDRARQGDPEAQTEGSRRVLAHHRTSGADVMAYGVRVNKDPARATRLGELVAGAAENCS